MKHQNSTKQVSEKREALSASLNHHHPCRISPTDQESYTLVDDMTPYINHIKAISCDEREKTPYSNTLNLANKHKKTENLTELPESFKNLPGNEIAPR